MPATPESEGIRAIRIRSPHAATEISVDVQLEGEDFFRLVFVEEVVDGILISHEVLPPGMTAGEELLMFEKKNLYCTTCGASGKAKNQNPGSFAIELFLCLLGFLTLFMLIPAALYSLWRLAATTPVCRACGASALIPAASPRARASTVQR